MGVTRENFGGYTERCAHVMKSPLIRLQACDERSVRDKFFFVDWYRWLYILIGIFHSGNYQLAHRQCLNTR